ncbi:MAG: DUF3391 domain-containing protein [Agarilytica sp.]
MVKKRSKSIPLSSLKVGMHISKLDIPWVDSPFLSHSRTVKSEKDIQLLKNAGVKNLVIDPNKGLDIDTSNKEEAPEPNASKEKSHPKEANPTEILKTTTPQTAAEKRGRMLEAEMQKGLKIRKEVRDAIHHALADITAGKNIETEPLLPLIDQTLESLARNNQALLNLAHLSRRTQKLADHSFSTLCIALNLARVMKINEQAYEALGVAALLHEAGWAQIPIQLMGKRTPYTETETKLIERHSELGVRFLSNCKIPEISSRVIEEHHERCDGSGYPKQMRGNALHPLSKLFAVVDRYDELVHQLNDKPGMLPNNALRVLYLEAQQGMYDNNVVASLISLLGVYPISTAVKLNDGRVGIVREVHSETPLLPLVEIHIDANGKVLDTPIYIDLASQEEQKRATAIESVIDAANATDPTHKRLTLDA